VFAAPRCRWQARAAVGPEALLTMPDNAYPLADDEPAVQERREQ
jgi:hypothetical protein